MGQAPPPPERGAAVIAGLTAASRGMGLVRTLVVTGVLGLTYLGNTYTSTNLVSNLLFDVFAGGALAAVLVPALRLPSSATIPPRRSGAPAPSPTRCCWCSRRWCSRASRCAVRSWRR
jgi:hypothetical protein